MENKIKEKLEQKETSFFLTNPKTMASKKHHKRWLKVKNNKRQERYAVIQKRLLEREKIQPTHTPKQPASHTGQLTCQNAGGPPNPHEMGWDPGP